MVIFEGSSALRVPSLVLISWMVLYIAIYNSVRAQVYVSSTCSNHTYFSSTPSDLFQNNLDSLFKSFSDVSSDASVFNTTKGSYPDEVYGMFICKAHVSAKTCYDCVTAAITQILVECPLNNDAIIWFDKCVIQYSNKLITFPSLEKDPSLSFISIVEKDPYLSTQLLILLTVLQAANRVTYCLAENNEGIVLTPNCSIRYELNPFSKVIPTPPPAPAKVRKERKSKIMISASISASVLMALLGLCLCYYYCIRSKKAKNNISSHQQTERSNTEFQLLDFDDSLITENQVDSLDFPSIELDVIHKATQHFSEANKLGEGGFGPVYKGTLLNGKQIAVKRLSRSSGQGMKEFKAEVTLIARLQHRNLVKLLGCSLKNNEMLLVYDYMLNKSLDVFLFDSTRPTQLDWKRRFNIINDHDMNPKISDFGMARIFGSNQTEANTNRVVGTYGYMAPEYAMEGIFSVKSDVYSFGVLMLEMISGRKNNGFYLSGQGHSLLDYAWKLWSEDKELELLDPLLTKSFVVNEVLKCIHIGLLCVQDDPANRPTMSSINLMLGSDMTTFSEPLQPLFFVGRVAPSAQPQPQSTETGSSVNGITISDFPPR
ncbi:hypothetical protein POM88_031372 [Heracleum sosnowskyi]|uniref:non-specific serine/threonine protein kinase n=1 Tax=Heracleum sosnowskyi TaxID=360622 RepID=A0AAD8HYH7_9APIA|nr:hypothetical protein POM88_031372 [Heracleum sosnowskyi]